MQKHAEIKDVFAEAQPAKTETNTWNNNMNISSDEKIARRTAAESTNC